MLRQEVGQRAYPTHRFVGLHQQPVEVAMELGVVAIALADRDGGEVGDIALTGM